ncbi:MAG TPA: hypothetical protein VMG14_06450 [Thermoplasmata archaeon]|nr:hypothetical protein [Thermoplasmata archaeon]
MTDPPTVDLLLFVAAAPDPGEGVGVAVDSSVFANVTRAFTGSWIVLRPAGPARASPAAADGPSGTWKLPRAQAQAARLVLDLAKAAGRTVLLVDVERPEGLDALVQRWYSADDLLPKLVRSDGAALEGEEMFTPRLVRSFLTAGTQRRGRQRPLP